MNMPALAVVVTESQLLEDLLRRSLEAQGFVVLALEDGGELSDFLELMDDPHGRQPQLVLMDATVPGPSALELAAGARRRGMTFPFAVLTSTLDESTRDVARSLRVNLLPLPRLERAPRATTPAMPLM